MGLTRIKVIFWGGIIWDFLWAKKNICRVLSISKATKFCEITSPGILSLKKDNKKSEENTLGFGNLLRSQVASIKVNV